MKAIRVFLVVAVILGILFAVARYRRQVALDKKKREEAAAIEAGRHPQPVRDYSEAGKKSNDQLLAIFEDFENSDKFERINALELLAERKEPRVHDTLRSLVNNDQDSVMQEGAAKGLGFFADPDDFAALQKLATQTNNSVVAREAAASLGRLHDKRALPVLLKLWGHGDNRVSRGAAEGLGLYGPEGLAILLKHLDKKERYLGQQEEIAQGVAAATAANVPGALPALIDIFQHHSSSSARIATIDVLASRPEPEAQEAFRGALHDKDQSVKSAAVEAIKPGTPHAVALLQTLLNDPDKFIQQRVGTALFQIDTPESGKLLDQAMAEKDLGVIAGAYLHYLPVNDPAQVTVLAAAMREDGGESMATALLNDSHAELSQAAHDWANANGFQVIPQVRYVQH